LTAFILGHPARPGPFQPGRETTRLDSRTRVLRTLKSGASMSGLMALVYHFPATPNCQRARLGCVATASLARSSRLREPQRGGLKPPQRAQSPLRTESYLARSQIGS